MNNESNEEFVAKFQDGQHSPEDLLSRFQESINKIVGATISHFKNLPEAELKAEGVNVLIKTANNYMPELGPYENYLHKALKETLVRMSKRQAVYNNQGNIFESMIEDKDYALNQKNEEYEHAELEAQKEIDEEYNKKHGIRIVYSKEDTSKVNKQAIAALDKILERGHHEEEQYIAVAYGNSGKYTEQEKAFAEVMLNGMDSGQKLSMEQVAKKLNISVPRASQLSKSIDEKTDGKKSKVVINRCKYCNKLIVGGKQKRCCGSIECNKKRQNERTRKTRSKKKV